MRPPPVVLEPRPGTRWGGDAGVYLLWAMTGALGVPTLAGLLSIGILMLPFAIVTFVLAVRRTFVNSFRPWCAAGLVLPVGLGVAWLGSWFTYASSSPGDHCYRSNGGVTCEGSGNTDNAGQTIETTPHHAGGLQWSHTGRTSPSA